MAGDARTAQAASPPPAWHQVQRAALAPLVFAARDDFARLERVFELEATLLQQLRRLQGSCPHAASAASVEPLIALIPAATAPRAERVRGLGRLLAALQAWCADGAAFLPLPPSPPTAMVGAKAEADLNSEAATSPAPIHSSSPRRASVAPAVASVSLPAARSSHGARVRAAANPSGGPLRLDSALSALRGLGPRTCEHLAARGLTTVEELLRFFPRRFRSRQSASAMAELRADLLCTVEGQVQAVRERYVRGRHHLEVVLTDGSGTLHLVWFRAPGRSFSGQFVRGARFAASGTVRRHGLYWQMAHPEVRRLEDVGDLGFAQRETEAAGIAPAALAEPSLPIAPGGGADPDWAEDAVVPLYLEVEGLHPHALRRIIRQTLPLASQWTDPLPASLLAARGLCGVAEAARALHEPGPGADANALEERRDPWHQRLIYEELFFLQLGLLRRRQEPGRRERAVTVPRGEGLVRCARALLPFSLTGAQARVLGEIEGDLAASRPMQRLLQGDVGSGKTAVAWVAALRLWQHGQQTALMAPTELLAEQHAAGGRRWLGALGVPVALLTGSTPARERRDTLQRLAAGEPMVVVGTHALIAQRVHFGRLGLGIVDEQHRFGVLQRARLSALGKAGQNKLPHMLVMTATPIPRTLSLTVYGDLDSSVLDELPPGRQPVATQLYRERDRAKAYALVREAVAQGRQAYVVFPLVEASDKEGMEDIRAATESAEELLAGPLAGLRLALLHGRVTAEAKEAIMRRFVGGELDVLVATTVVEVGIDVPNATAMVIEHAERFGLSQLHQLRGRVGRGTQKSFCLLLTRGRGSQAALERLQVMANSNDGFHIAEADLAIRGPGDFVGTRQSGLPVLSLADLTRDRRLLEWAREDARDLLSRSPALDGDALSATRARFAVVWEKVQPLVDAG